MKTPNTVVATREGCGSKKKIVLIVNKFGNLQAQPA